MRDAMGVSDAAIQQFVCVGIQKITFFRIDESCCG